MKRAPVDHGPIKALAEDGGTLSFGFAQFCFSLLRFLVYFCFAVFLTAAAAVIRDKFMRFLAGDVRFAAMALCAAKDGDC